jgi:hypothetical protein
MVLSCYTVKGKLAILKIICNYTQTNQLLQMVVTQHNVLVMCHRFGETHCLRPWGCSSEILTLSQDIRKMKLGTGSISI